MKSLLVTLLVAAGFLAAPLSTGAEVSWSTDATAALAQAKKEKKLVVMDFTGSDWCGWCIKLKKEVFDTAEFATYAKDNLVLVEVDFPSKKQQSPALKKANEELKSKYAPKDGFPTIIVLNSEGKQVWKQVGYMPGGPKAWIGKLDEAKKK